MRKELDRRPLVVAGIALAVGLTVVAHPANLLFVVAMLAVAEQSRTWIVASVALVAGLLLCPGPTACLADRSWVSGEATIVSIPREYGERQLFEVEFRGRRLQAVAPTWREISVGERWLISGVAGAPSELSSARARDRGIAGEIDLVAGSMQRLQSGPWPYRVADRTRRSFIAFSVETVGSPDADWIQAFCIRLGMLEPDSREALVRTGTIHLISASGLHVAIVAALVGLVLLPLGLPRPITIAVIVLTVCMYGLITGLHMPTIRAIIALTLGLVAYLFRRQFDGLSSLALANIVFLTWQPREIYSAGVQLSTVVVAALILFMPRDFGDGHGVWRRIKQTHKDLWHVAVIAAAAGEPVLAAREGFVSLSNIPANILLVMPISLAIAAAITAFALSPISWPLAKGIMLTVVAPIVQACRRVLEGPLGSETWVLSLPAFSPYWLVLYFGAWVALGRPFERR